VTLCDAGPLVALIDQADPHHARCAAVLQSLPSSPLLTTWPCLTEAMYFLGKTSGFRAQDVLWGFCSDRLLCLHEAAEGEWERIRSLMRQYADSPMDLADASLVAAAEGLGFKRIFTLDGHFRAYRIGDRGVFEVVP
jgi:uncharacterized protein